jgi:hypothetical protein
MSTVPEIIVQKRQRRIEIIRKRLLRKRWPRFQVSLIILLTGLTGFLTSFLLLQLGLDQMAVRYPLAIGVAYCGFLTLLALWLWLQRHEIDGDLFVEVVERIPGDPLAVGDFRGGGDFGGGGAGGSFGGSAADSLQGGGSSLAGARGFDFDLEDLSLLILAAAALLAGLLSTFYIIYIAPSLLAEILVDGALLAGLYRRVKRIEERHWLRAAIRRTLLPAVLVAVFFSFAGFTMQKLAPNAHTIGDVWQHVIG